MTWIVAQFLGAGRWLSWLGGVVVRAAKQYPWQCALIVALLAVGWEHHGKTVAEGQRDALKAQIDQMQAAAAAAVKRNATRVTENQDVHETLQRDGRVAVARYIAAHTIRVQDSGSAAPQGGAAVLPAQPSASTVVAVSADDLRTCDADYTYALSAFLLGKAKVDAGDAAYAEGR